MQRVNEVTVLSPSCDSEAPDQLFAISSNQSGHGDFCVQVSTEVIVSNPSDGIETPDPDNGYEGGIGVNPPEYQNIHTSLFQSQSVRTPSDVSPICSGDFDFCQSASVWGSGSPKDDPGQQ